MSAMKTEFDFDAVQALKLGEDIRQLFPYFKGRKAGAFLDSAASSLKPLPVVDRMSHYLLYEHANIHRGAYALSAEATRMYDQARDRLAAFINAPDSQNVIFTRGTTEGINLVAHSFGQGLAEGDSVLLSAVEHHSNIVPWHLLKSQKGIQVSFVEIDQSACIDMQNLEEQLRNLKPKLVSMLAHSNAFGSLLPVHEIVELAHRYGAKVLIDAAQVAPHARIDVQDWKADFVVFSGHKMYGPTGIGVLYMTDEMLESLPPFHGGGDMIEEVAFEQSTFAPAPRKFEAGTPAIAEAIGLGVAAKFIEAVGFDNIHAHEREMFAYAWELLEAEQSVTLLGPGGEQQSSIIAFTLEGVHPHDIATIADTYDVQIRAGHHCAMPALKKLGIPATARASFGVYSTRADIDTLREALRHAHRMFAA